jgi:MFS family permease
LNYKWVVISVTSVGTFMFALDTRIVIVGLPTIGRELGIGIDELVWVTQAYVLTSTVIALLVGRTGDQIGRVKLFTLGFVIFTIGSALAAISFTGPELIASRAVQGIGGALLVSNSAAMLVDVAKGREVGTLLGINMVAVSAGAIAGFTLSGVILSITDWRALFYVNIPIGIFGTYWARTRLLEISVRDPQKWVDKWGFVTFGAGLTLILLGLTFLSYGPGSLALGASSLGSGVLLLVVFLRLQARSRAPLLDLRLFKIRQFAAGNLALFFQAIAWFGLSIVVSFYLQIGLGLSALDAGLEFLPLQVAVVMSAYLTGRVIDRHGRLSLVSNTGNVLTIIGLAILAYTLGNPDTFLVSVALFIFGIGNGMFITSNRSATLSSVAPDKRGAASGFSTTVSSVCNSMSYGIVILLMTLIIPYAQLTGLLQGTTSLANAAAHVEFLNASRYVVIALMASLIACVFPTLFLDPKSRVGRVEDSRSSDMLAAEG